MTTNTDPVRALIGQWRDAAEFFKGDAGSDIRETLMACARELEAALPQRPPSAPVGVEDMQRRLDREESEHGRTIDQRDAAEDALGRMFQAVTGRPAEWSSAWGYVDAIEEVEEHVATLAQQPAAVDEFVTIDGKRYDVDIVRTALPGLASDPATQHQEPKS